MPTATTTDVRVITDAIDVRQIRSIELADGWHNVSDCQLVQFAVGEAKSPVMPDKLYPTLRYEDEFGTLVRTPLNKILSFSEEPHGRR
jgi:hypothetical protein